MQIALVLLVAVALLSCSSDSATTPTADSTKHYVGQSYGGGVVFYTWKDVRGEEHGLIVSIRNLSDSSIWSNVDDALWPVVLDWYNGKSNTAAIIAQNGHTNSAALLCADYSAGGYNDWYLPTPPELTVLYNNIPAVNSSLSEIDGAAPIDNFSFWSSYERSDKYGVYTIAASDNGVAVSGGLKTISKTPVRAVRSY